MKRLTCVPAIVLGLVAITTTAVVADSDARSVTGAARGLFGAGAALGVVELQQLELGTGVFIEAGGSASGTFHAVLHGSAQGVPQQITLEGTVSGGSVAADGRATFSGTASLDYGDGAPPFLGVPFSVVAASDGLVLAIDSVTLPSAGLTAGVVSIE